MIEGSGSGSIPLTNGSPRIRIQEAQKHVDPVDPDPDSDLDPQHCSELYLTLLFPIGKLMNLLASYI
jgi:hypothetical protein